MTEEATTSATGTAVTAAPGKPTERREAQDQVTVRMPAEGAYLSVLRTATAGLAARLDFTLDEIEDLRIAVDEACAMLLSQAVPGASLECEFTLGHDDMTIAVSVACLAPQQPASDTFAWTVLTALAGSVDAHVGPGDLLTIVLRKTRSRRGRCDAGNRGRFDRGVRGHDGCPARGPGGRRPNGEPAIMDFAEVREGEALRAAVTGAADTGAPLAAAKVQHATRERGRARELFERLATLPEGGEERQRIRGELVELHLPLVEYLARRFRNRGEWLDDLTQVATIGLIKSIDRFDLSRGVEFSTYATPTIVGEIKRHFRDKGWAVRVPRRLQELKLALTKAISDLAQRLGRAPTVAELAAHLQMSEEEVLEGLESANAYSTVSLDAPDSGDEDAPAVAESLGMLDDALEGVEYRESLKPLLERLPPREKKILMLRFFGNMTQSQIATELGISQMHVSRLLARTLTQLREGLTTDD